MTDDSLWHTGHCTACEGAELRDFLALRSVPTQDGVLCRTKQDARPRPKVTSS